MSSLQTVSPKKDVCVAGDKQDAIHGKENNDRINSKRINSPAMDLFTRVFKFDHSSEQHNLSSLLQHMKYIKSHVSSSINECYEKSLKAAKLKDSIQHALIWVMLYHQKLPKDKNSSIYLESMSNLLAMYIDMELRASRRGKEHFSAITSRLICCLYVYLENSTEHILDTLIKIRHMTNQFHLILDPIMTKILKSLTPHPKTEIMYVRYLLGFRLWRKINNDLAVRKKIQETAVSILGSPPSVLPEFLSKYIVSSTLGPQTLSSRFLMTHKFDMKACCAEFLTLCRKSIESSPENQGEIDCSERAQDTNRSQLLKSAVEESSSIKINNSFVHEKSIADQSCVSLVQNKPSNVNVSNKSNISENLGRISINDTANLPSNNESVKIPRPLVRPKPKRSSDIIIIDITDEESTPKITRKKIRKNFPWMKEIKKQGFHLTMKNKDNPSMKIDSPAKEILQSLIQITEDSDQKKIDSDLYSSFDSWIGFDHLKPTSDIHEFFDDEVYQTSKPPPVNTPFGNTNTTQVPTAISSPIICTSVPTYPSPNSVSRISRERLNSYDSDSAESNSVTKYVTSQEIFQVARFNTFKTDCQSEADSMISDSNENLRVIPAETSTVSEGISTMVLKENHNSIIPNVQNHTEDNNISTNQFSEQNEATESSRSEEKIESTNNEFCNELNRSEELALRNDYSKAVDYTLSGDKSTLHTDFLNESVHSSYETGNERSHYAFQDSQLMENSALHFLANVSLQDAGQISNLPPKTIKVKDYARLRDPFNSGIDTETCYQSPESSSPDVTNRMVTIYPEDAFDKVALQVEVISTSDGSTMENVSQFTRETTNAILSGETVVLMQKSPNSNVYVINKATEKKNSGEEAFEDGEKEAVLSQEILGSETLLMNFESRQFDKEISRGIIVKSEPERKNLKSGSIEDLKKSLSSESNINKSSTDKRKNLYNGNLTCRKSVKQDYNVANHLTCEIPNYSMVHPLSHDLSNPQIPSTHPAALYSNFTPASELYVPYHEHCMSCGLPENQLSGLHSHTNTNQNRTNCSCLAYEMVTHCRQCIHPTPEPHSSYIEGNSYFIPQHSSVQSSTVQELERTNGESMITNLYKDQLLYKKEQNLWESKPLEDISIKFNPEVKYEVEINNKLPLKKRLKAISMIQKPYDLSIKVEKSGDYPATPMISIANLEIQNDPRILKAPEIGCTVDSGKIIRRDYRRDGVIPHNHRMEKIRENNKDQRRLVKGQLKNVSPYNDACYQRPIQTSKSRKEVGVSSLKRLAVMPGSPEKPAKKAKKSSTRQTRSSQRNVPKVNYSYTDVDPEWNPSGDQMRRKKKKTSR